MNRRELLKTTGIAALGILSLPALAKAQNRIEDDSELMVAVSISFNHGHELKLNSDDLVKILNQAQNEGPVSLDIQGKSGHPHTIELNETLLMDLISGKAIEVQSSVDAGHSHKVRLEILT